MMPRQPRAGAGHAGPEQATGRLGRVTTALVVAVVLVVLLVRRTPVLDVAIYAAYVGLGVVGPGLLVHKALRGSQGSWLADLGLGAATGLVLGLGAWLAVSLLDLRGWLWAWPVLTLAVLFPPGARGRVRERPSHCWPRGPTVATAAAALLVVVQQTVAYVGPNDLPPSGRGYYPDLLWHLGLASEATRAFPLQTPQVADAGTLRYHWFSNAHVAATSLMTGIDVQTVMLRLWVLPVSLLFVVLTAVLAEKVSGQPWAGAAAAWLALPTTTLPFWPSIVPGLAHLSGYSPSQLFAYPMILLTLHALVDAVRQPSRRWGTLTVMAIGALGCSGAKSSALPVVVGGVATALVAGLALRRNRLRLLALTATGLGLTGVALLLVSGGDSGAGVQLLSSLTILTPYRLLGLTTPDFDTLLPAGLVAGAAGGLLLVGLLIATAIGAVRSLAFVLPFVQRRLRGDLAAWLLAGVCASSLVPFLVVGHQGYSEYYFLYSSLPAGCALLAWSLSDAVTAGAPGRRPTGWAVAAGAVLTAAVGAWALAGPAPGTPSEMVTALRTFVVQVTVGGLAIVGGLLVGARVSRRRATARATHAGHGARGEPARRTSHLARAAAIGLAVLVGALGGSAVLTTLRGDLAAPEPAPVSREALAQSEAALWVRSAVATDALLAVNTHCLSGSGPGCDSRRWWLSGLSGRRVLLESWAYVPTAAHTGYDDPGLLRLNQQAFEAPTPGVLAQLRARGVGWLVGERIPGQPVSGRLDELADRRYDNGLVTVWQLRP